MNTFKWFVSKFRKPANPAGSKFIMGDTSKRREKREGSSMSERVQKGKNELQKVRNKLVSLIMTIPLEILHMIYVV